MLAKKPKAVSELYVFYDYETYKNIDREHVPFYIFAKDFEGNEWEFTTNEDFCKWAMSMTGYTFIAHNAKGYDSMFIFKYCLENGLKPDIIKNGTKIMLMKVKKAGVRFIDSYNFIAQPLRTFPKTFGLEEVAKGYFPHKFSSHNNLKYKGGYPGIEFYDPDRMNVDERKDFLKWYEEVKNEEFDFQKEMKKYCKADVEVLRQACMKFREDIIQETTIVLGGEEYAVDPFQYTTIASAA